MQDDVTHVQYYYHFIFIIIIILCTPRIQYWQTARREWCTASHEPNAPAPTLAKWVNPWTSAFKNTLGSDDQRP